MADFHLPWYSNLSIGYFNSGISVAIDHEGEDEYHDYMDHES